MSITLEVAQLVPNPENLRSTYDDASIEELADSIMTVGLVNPLSVASMSDGKFMVTAGHRRLRALQLLIADGRMPATEPVHCLVHDLPADIVVAQMLVENLQRSDLDPLDEAHGYLKLTAVHGYTTKQLAKMIGRREQLILDRLALLTLPEPVQPHVGKSVSLDHAVRLTKIADEKEREKLCKSAASGKLHTYDLDAVERRQVRDREKAELDAALESMFVTVFDKLEDAGVSWREVEFDGRVDVERLRTLVVANDRVLVRSGTSLSLYRKLTAEELEAKAVADKYGVDVGEEITPHDEWRLREEEWQEQVDAFRDRQHVERAVVVKNLGTEQLRIISLESADFMASQFEHKAMPFYRLNSLTGWMIRTLQLPSDDEKPNVDVVKAWLAEHPTNVRRLWVLESFLLWGSAASPTLDALFEEQFAQTGLDVEPTFDEIEPWQNEAGEWIVDRPKELSISQDDEYVADNDFDDDFDPWDDFDDGQFDDDPSPYEGTMSEA